MSFANSYVTDNELYNNLEMQWLLEVIEEFTNEHEERFIVVVAIHL